MADSFSERWPHHRAPANQAANIYRRRSTPTRIRPIARIRSASSRTNLGYDAQVELIQQAIQHVRFAHLLRQSRDVAGGRGGTARRPRIASMRSNCSRIWRKPAWRSACRCRR